MSEFSLDATASGSFQDVLQLAKGALGHEGFGILSEIDVRKTLFEKTGAAIDGYTILGVCIPMLALEAIRADPRIGVFLPCTVVVRESPTGVQVSAQDPELIDTVVGNPALKAMSTEAKSRIQRALLAIRS